MPQLGEEVRKIYVKSGTPLAGLDLSVKSVRVVESLGEPFTAEVELYGQKAPKDIGLKSLVGSDTALLVEWMKGEKYGWHGIVRSFGYVSAEPGGGENVHTYRAVIVPKMWRMALNAKHRVFTKVTTSDIVSQIFQGHGLSAPRGADLLNHGQRDHCMQFEETDLEFFARLAADEGITYRFQHSDSSSDLMLLKAPDSQSVTLSSLDISNLEYRAALHTGSSSTFDFDAKDFRMLSWTAKSSSPFAHTSSERWDFGRGYMAGPGEGLMYNTSQAQADVKNMIAHYESADAGSICSFEGNPLAVTTLFNCAPGVQIKGIDAIDGLAAAAGIKVLVLRREFEFEESYDSGFSGSARIACAQSTDHWAPPRRQRPRAPGLCSAVVSELKASPSDTGADPHRMVKVKFPWASPELASCWVRVAQSYAGKGWGASFVPRINQEVLVEFLNGDIDRPVVVGALYNGKNTGPAYTATQSGFKSESSKFNELRFDDKDGAEEVYLEAGKDFKYVVNENENGSVLKDYTLAVKGEQSTTVEKTRKDTTTQAHTIESKDSLELKVGGCTIKINAQGITIEALGNKIALTSSGVEVKGTQLKMSSDSTAELKANAKVSVEGSAMAELKSSGMTTVKGSMTMIN